MQWAKESAPLNEWLSCFIVNMQARDLELQASKDRLVQQENLTKQLTERVKEEAYQKVRIKWILQPAFPVTSKSDASPIQSCHAILRVEYTKYMGHNIYGCLTPRCDGSFYKPNILHPYKAWTNWRKKSKYTAAFSESYTSCICKRFFGCLVKRRPSSKFRTRHVAGATDEARSTRRKTPAN